MALLLSVLVLIVVIAIVFQIQITTMTSARVARNDVGLTAMDLAIESASLEVFEQLAADAEGAAAGGGAGGAGMPEGEAGEGEVPGGEGAAAGGGEAPPSDSKQDEWARPQRSEVNGIQLRILIQDEESKYNVLNLLTDDEDEAEEALERVRRILDLCREGTREDIAGATAEDMARAMRDYMKERDRFERPRPTLLTEDEERPNRVLPLSLREFLSLEPFEERHFRDYRDEDGTIVHSLSSFLTIWSSPAVQSEASGASQQGGGGGAPQVPEQTATGSGGEPSSPGARGGSAGGDEGAGGEGGGGQSAAGGQQEGGGPQAGGGAGGSAASAGYGVNLNTAPPLVLKSLFDDREVNPRFWDDIVEYRNLEEEDEDGGQEEEDKEPVFDEYGEEIVARKFFDSLDELGEVDAWNDYDAQVQGEIRSLLVTQSQVFSVYITARRSTAAEEGMLESLSGADRARQEEEAGNALVRTVRLVIWRRAGSEETEILPIVPWEVLDYVPFEVLDYPDERR